MFSTTQFNLTCTQVQDNKITKSKTYKNSDNRTLLAYLYLFLISSSNVWYSPASFFLDAFLMILIQEIQKARECTMIDNRLMEQKKKIHHY